MGHRNIVSAIEWLPEHLFTEEIVEAATESEEIEVLNHIPGRFLTPERIGRIIAYEKVGSSGIEQQTMLTRINKQGKPVLSL